MGLEANVGDVKFYHEEGNVLRVEVLGVREIQMGGKDNPGEEYCLKTLELVRTNPSIKESAHPKIGDAFHASKSNTAGAYAGWWLLDR